MTSLDQGGKNSGKVFHGLNFMRGVAAIAVAVFHAQVLFGRQLVQGGYLAVDLFFLMSGFVIAHAYDAKLRAGLGLLRFTATRLVRFVPFYYAGLILGLALQLVLVAIGSLNALSSVELVWAVFLGLLFLPLIRPGHDMFPLNVPAWSLHHELVVNVLFAAFHGKLTTRVLMAIGMVAALILIPGVVFIGHAAVGPLAEHYPLALARAVYSFTLGVLVYRLRPRKIASPIAAMLLTTAALLMPVPGNLRSTFDLACIIVIFPILLPSLVAFEPVSAFMRSVSRLLGDLSYGLYAVHYPMIWLVRGAAERYGFDPIVSAIFLIVALSVLCCVLESRVDMPLRKRINGLIARWLGGEART